MKKIILAAISLLPFFSLAQDAPYVVHGKVGSFNAPAKMYIIYWIKENAVKDSVVLDNGQFEFKGVVGKVPLNAYLVLNEKGDGLKYQDYKSFYIEQGDIKVNSNDKLANANVDGPKTNQDNARYNALIKPIDDEQEAHDAKEKAATDEQKKSEVFLRQLAAEQNAIDAKELAAIKQFIQQNPGSFISLNALEMYSAYGADYADIAPLYDNLTAEIKQTDAAKSFGERLPKLKAVALGQQAPLFTEADTAGKMISLESLRGKYVLVDFWASWCGPCRHENPNVVKAYSKYKDKNFTIIGVSLDQPTGKQKWLNAIHNDHLTWTQVSDLQFWKSKEAELYAVRGIPANFLLDPSGKIIAKSLHGFDLEDKLAEIFGKSTAAGNGGSK